MSANGTVHYVVQPGGKLTGDAVVPGDKSISHRSIMLGALADGTTHISGFLEGADSIATLNAFKAMGVDIQGPDNGKVVVKGVGIDGLKKPVAPLDLGNSGTSMRLMCGLLSAQSFDTVLIGDESLTKRPMRRVTDPLAKMGAKIKASPLGTAPLSVSGKQMLTGMEYEMPVASAQVKSCLILAGLYAKGKTCVTEPGVTRDHTERMLRAFGVTVDVKKNKICINSGQRLKATRLEVPADISSAAFFMVAASIAPGSNIVLRNVGINPTRTGVIDILKLMGADLEIIAERVLGDEPVADIRVKSATLNGIEIPETLVPLAIDEFPAIFIAAACAKGKTVLTGAEELRVKESDRIQAMADGLRVLGIDAEPTADGIVIEGGAIGGGVIESHGDHRIAMSFAISALRASAPIGVRNCDNVVTSFPGFPELAASLGLKIRLE